VGLERSVLEIAQDCDQGVRSKSKQEAPMLGDGPLVR